MTLLILNSLFHRLLMRKYFFIFGMVLATKVTVIGFYKALGHLH